MLSIKIIKDSSGSICAFEADGHTDLATAGSDIACAAASALVQSAILGCSEYLKISGGLIQEYGHIYFTLPMDLKSEDDAKAQAILNTMLLGLEQIEGQHPDRLKIEIEENLL